MVDENDSQWRALLRFGDLNRGGAPDPRHSLTPTPQDIVSVDVSHSRVFPFGVIDLGAGYRTDRRPLVRQFVRPMVACTCSGEARIDVSPFRSAQDWYNPPDISGALY